MCPRWRVKFPAGDFSPHDALQLGRSFEVGSDQTEAFTENNQPYTMQEIADILRISTSVVIGESEKLCLLFYGKKLHKLVGKPSMLLAAQCPTPHQCICWGPYTPWYLRMWLYLEVEYKEGNSVKMTSYGWVLIQHDWWPYKKASWRQGKRKQPSQAERPQKKLTFLTLSVWTSSL